MIETSHVVALGYRWFPTAAGYHIERAFQTEGHRVAYVGLGEAERPGYGETTSIARIVQALPEPPDFYLWIDPAGRYFPREIEQLPIPTACYLIDVHLGGWRPMIAQFFDIVFLAQKDYVDAYRRALGHDQVYWLPLAAAPDVHRRHDLPTRYDVAFVGNIALAHRQTARTRRLELLRSRYTTNDFYRHYTPAEVGEIYSQAKIVFNTSIAGDVTMRVFEGSASGALVLTDSVANGLNELFQVGKELVVFQDDQDLLAKIDYYLAHDQERRDIAAAGYQRTHAQHTYPHRVQTIVGHLQSDAFRRLAPLRSATAAQRRAARTVVYTRLHMLDALLDDARTHGRNPLQRAVDVLPCLLRQLIV